MSGPEKGERDASMAMGPISMSLKQTGSQYPGTLTMTGELVSRSGPTQGVVSGSELRVVEPNDLTGYLSVQGNEMPPAS